MATVARILIKDQRSVMGGNMAIIEQTTGFDPLRLSRMQLKNALKFRIAIPDDLGWVPETLNDLLEDRIRMIYKGGEDMRPDIDDINESIHALCTS